MKTRSIVLAFALLLFFAKSHAQYCTPSVTSTGAYLVAVHFNLPPHTQGVTGGIEYNTVSNGYTDNSAVSSGTINRICYTGIPINVRNPGNNPVLVNTRVFIDWNNDFDFDDAGEMMMDDDRTIAGQTTAGFGSGWYTPANAPSTVRVRFCVREGGAKATACGGYTGEIEEFKLTIATNTAPTINGSATAFINPLKETQTDNEGFTTRQLFNSSINGITLTGDVNSCSTGGFAITGTTGSNGHWEYKIGAGAWTNFGVVSASNALLLEVDKENNPSEIPTRIRFVPSGSGTSGIVFRAWDRSTGLNGQYADVSSAGGTTAFSTANGTAQMITYSAAASATDVDVYMPSAADPAYVYNVRKASLNRSTGIFKTSETITSDGSEGYGIDIAIDYVNHKLVWLGGTDGLSIMRSNMDGSNVQLISTFGNPTGLAIGNNKIYVADAFTGIYKMNLDGSGKTLVAGTGEGLSATGDIEFANGQLFYLNTDDWTTYNIMQINTDGSGMTAFYSTSGAINGITSTGSSLYWTENDGSGGSVKTLPFGGGLTFTLTTEPYAFQNLIVDESKSTVYISALSLPGYNMPRILSLPIDGGTTTRVLDMPNTVAGFVMNTASGTLPVHFISVKAFRQTSGNEVQWNVGQEENLLNYVVERSADGRSFTATGTVTASGRNAYAWIDIAPLPGKNYYRIRSVDIDGTAKYSSVVMVDASNRSAVSVFPTVSSNGQFNLKLENAAAGKYMLTAINASGQQVFSQSVLHTGGSTVQGISLPAGTPKGVYRIKISGQDKAWVETIIIK